MKRELIAIVSLYAISILPGMAEIEAKELKYYRPLMEDLAGESLSNLLHSIDTPLPQESQIDINRKIGRREFLRVLEQQIKGKITINGPIAGLTVFEGPTTMGDFDAKLKTTSIIEALEYYSERTGNVWQIERSEDGIYLLIRAGEKNAGQSGAGNGLDPLPK